MANELKHKDVGGALSKEEWEGTDTHIADGQTINDIFYFNGTSWVRGTLETYLNAKKIIVMPNDGKIQFGTRDGSVELFAGDAAEPFELFCRPKDGDTVGEFCVLPKGEGNQSASTVANKPDHHNCGYFTMQIGATFAAISGGKTGIGSAPTQLTFNLPINMQGEAIGNLSKLGFGGSEIITLSSDIGAYTKTNIKLKAEAGVTDDCIQLTGGIDGDIIIVRADAGDTITLKDGANMIIGGDIALSGDNGDMVMLLNIGNDKHRKLAAFADN